VTRKKIDELAVKMGDKPRKEKKAEWRAEAKKSWDDMGKRIHDEYLRSPQGQYDAMLAKEKRPGLTAGEKERAAALARRYKEERDRYGDSHDPDDFLAHVFGSK
jgi:hypothetical protein